MMLIDDINIGDFKEFQVKISLESHENFENKIKDHSPVHTDDKFAVRAGFREKIAYAFDVVSHLSRLYGEYLPGGSSICLKQDIKFIHPVYINDILTVRGEVLQANRNLKILTILSTIKNQDGVICVKGKGNVQIVL